MFRAAPQETEVYDKKKKKKLWMKLTNINIVLIKDLILVWAIKLLINMLVSINTLANPFSLQFDIVNLK